MRTHRHLFRIRYGETDQMGTFYNARVLEWFEVGRTEFSRALGLPYAVWEERGVFLPLIEAHVRFQGRGRYDDLLEMEVGLKVVGRARLRFDNKIVQAAGGGAVAEVYTVHAVVNPAGRPIRFPAWLDEFMRAREIEEGAAGSPTDGGRTAS